MPPNTEFSVSVAFDDNDAQRFQANHIVEFDNTVMAIPNLENFLEQFARSKDVKISGGGVDRKVRLSGSRAASIAFGKCLGLASRKFVNSKIYYGSREGMTATVMSETGLNTDLAEIRIKHTRENAKAFCEGYVLDASEKCINETMADVKIENRVFGNCHTGEFVDAHGYRYRFEGRNHDPNVMAEFRLRSLRDDQVLDGSSASGYGTAIGVLAALCPARAADEGFRN